MQTISPEIVRGLFMDLFCTPAPALENPMYKTSHASRPYCILDQGDIEGYTGFWAEDDETHEEGFLQDAEDVFSLFDEHASAWKARRFPGRRLRRGPRKGKGKGKKGKGTKARRLFSPPGKKKGKSFDTEEVEAGIADLAKGERKKGNGKGKQNGKGKGKKGDRPGPDVYFIFYLGGN